MKFILSFFLACIMYASAFAQQKKPIEKAVIPTPTVQCDMCKNKIEKWMAHQDGVQSVKVDVKKKTTTIQYVTARTNEENLKTQIANAGYDAGDVTAEETAYKKLPNCCKKPEDQK